MMDTPAFKVRIQPLKIVAVTAYVDNETFDQAEKAGIAKVYAKPVSSSDLKEALSDLGLS